MSTVAHPAAAVGHDGDENRFQIYVQIAMLLAVITGIEIVAIYIPLARWIIFGGLVVLSLVKFLFVIFYFMHLKWDKPFCTVLFMIGLAWGGGTAWALVLLARADASRPLTSPANEQAEVR
ncbi:cytochrome C oxidase subunit IV family protein [Horticoccus luteus]|uniref:Cytochrome C oxidase subunit IV family protein n=1 Tax=Horticoccus luteus TaxID=2862869 RepID=A0A8F9TVR9_9BACT|nr:cytochrome C oxidase subunit IV family protein [Horticoccus luteus]QYM79980.1 cytochrome C oxidase subunit IV family protein [Horticoccus luteus]